MNDLALFDLLGLFIVLGFGIRAGWGFCDFVNEVCLVALDRFQGWLLRRNARRVLEAASPVKPLDVEAA